MSAPCIRDPRFLQPGEQEDWHLLPSTASATRICAELCPRPLVVQCAQTALWSGNPAGERGLAPADGVIAAGIVCRGDDATADALRAVIAENAPTDQPGIACQGCGRTLVDRKPRRDTEARRAARGLCHGCYSATKRDHAFKRLREIRPALCTGCSRPLVGRAETPPEGHARYHSRGLCHSCHTRQARANRKTAA